MSDEHTQSPIVYNFGDISSAATRLVDKISSAVGIIYEPTNIVRLAKAEAEAALIRAQGDLQVSDIQHRAVHRLMAEEEKRQANIESITAQALPQLEDSTDAGKMDDDWISNFFDKSRNISDKEMQQIWSKILAGEANSPGTFSKRTVNLLESFDKVDAEKFSTLCGTAWMIGPITPIIFDQENEIYQKLKLGFTELAHLESLGLLRFDSNGFSKTHVPSKFSVTYLNSRFAVTLAPNANGRLDVGRVLLSQMGRQLGSICQRCEIPGFAEYVIQQWQMQGHTVKPFSEENSNSQLLSD